jgi:ADP-ribose pyrophosphatase YjhB (NUDIX family)
MLSHKDIMVHTVTMSTQHIHKSPIDHYIQADIVRRLFSVTGAQSFSALKPDDIENSLFMYHMRKLEDRNIVERTDDGFALTDLGAQWVNYVGPSTLQPKLLPRLLINFIITNSDKSKVLLSRRKGQAAAKLNEYLLPGGLYSYSNDLPSAAQNILQDMHITGVTPSFLGVIEVINRLPNGFSYHTVSFFHHVTLDGPAPKESDYYAEEWVNMHHAADKNSSVYTRPTPDILQRFINNAIRPFETIAFDS